MHLGLNASANEPIEVAAHFCPPPKIIEPLALRYRGKVTRVIKINLHYQKRQGRNTLHVYNVTTGDDHDLILSFDSERLQWYLAEICD